MDIIEITEANFEEAVLQSELPFLVDFWADWCGPCHMIAPIVAEIAAENVGTLRVGKLNVDEQAALASAFRVMSIPTLMLFVGGEAVAVVTGAQPKAMLMQQLAPHLS
jgi:thioredoxin 1